MDTQTQIMPDFCSRRHPFHYTTALNILRKMGMDVRRINILADGEYENYKGEIREQSPKPGTEVTPRTAVTLKVGFPSPVDYMPYQFFFGLTGARETDRSWEERSRRLMAPFDAAVVRHDADARYQILKYDGGIVEKEFLLRVLALYGFDFQNNIRKIGEIVFLFAILPSFYHWSGNPALVERILQFFFKFKFEIIENSSAAYPIPESIQYRLGSKSGRLGRETIMGRTFTECDSCYDVVISGIEPKEVEELLPDKPMRKKLDWLLSFCMPNNMEYKIKIKVKPKMTPVGADRKLCYLGYSSFI
jgi:hypothetical protein